MKTLIVPCAGSHTFAGKPLFLQRHPGGKWVYEKTIEGIYPQQYDRIIYIVLDEAEKKYGAGKIIKEDMGRRYPIEIVVLPKMTSGPAETIYQIIKHCNIEGEVTVKDSHSFTRINQPCAGNYIAGLDLIVYSKHVESLRSKSFIMLNEQNHVLDVLEKKFRSDVISVGLYGFRSSKDYLFAYEHVNDKNYPIKKLYISHIISYLIGYKERVFHCVYAEDYEDWSTENTWKALQKQYAICILDIDALFGTEAVEEFSMELLQSLQHMSHNGVRFIACIASRDADDNMFQKFFASKGINCVCVIKGCLYSNAKIVVANREELSDLMFEV